MSGGYGQAASSTFMGSRFRLFMDRSCSPWNRGGPGRPSVATTPACAVASFCSILLLAGCQTPHSASQSAHPLVVNFQEDFLLEEPPDVWVFRTPALWRIAIEGDRHLLQMAIPPPRPLMPGAARPQEYAIYNQYEFRSFNLSCRVRIDREVSTRGRDACIIFGRQDNVHLYYVNLSSLSEDANNNLVRVDGRSRTVLIPRNRQPAPAIADRAWHKVDIQRDCDRGQVKVFVDAFDPEDPPLFDATDKTYDWGYLGFGSFDDHASFAHILVEGEGRRPELALQTDPP